MLDNLGKLKETSTTSQPTMQNKFITAQGNYRFRVPSGQRYSLAITGTFNSSTATAQFLSETAGTAQVETATVVAAGGITADGTAVLTFTQSGEDSSITVPVALTTTTHTTATLIATAIAAALNLDGRVTRRWTVTSSVADVIFTRKRDSDGFFAENNAELNLAIPGGLGITAAATSVNTTAGVAPVLTAYPYSTAAVAPDTARALTAAGEILSLNIGSHNEINLAVTGANPTGIMVVCNVINMNVREF